MVLIVNSITDIYSATKSSFQRPALSLKIAQDYFENNLSDPDDQFQRNGDFYERTIGEDDLTLSFSDNADGKNFFFKITVLYYLYNISYISNEKF